MSRYTYECSVCDTSIKTSAMQLTQCPICELLALKSQMPAPEIAPVYVIPVQATPRDKPVVSSPTPAVTKYMIYTDGACEGNPGPGGWGAVIDAPGVATKLISGYDRATTNNRMELMGAIAALEYIPVGAKAVLRTDSKYVLNGITSWISGWKANNWKGTTGNAIKNPDLWQRLDAANSARIVEWRWIKGHSGNVGNDLADKLAGDAIKQRGKNTYGNT